jgi:hypothetical protein
LEYPTYSTDLTRNDWWLFPKIKSALNRQRFQDIEDTPPPQKVTRPLKAFPTAGVPKLFPTVTASMD